MVNMVNMVNMVKENMTPEQFIQNIDKEIESLVTLYSQGSLGNTDVGIKLDSLGLPQESKKIVVELIHQAINESTYNLICGLEGSASLSGSQEIYKVIDESGKQLSGNLDDLFYEQTMEESI